MAAHAEKPKVRRSVRSDLGVPVVWADISGVYLGLGLGLGNQELGPSDE